MKRTILSLLVFFVTTMSWADNITAQEALQQAQSFIKQREDAGTRPKRVKGSASTQLTMVKQVSGLYLFNVKDNGGFVIVSNDDSTVPILGFSDSGAIDPDNMPSNMRAWLQGYADEIEWAKTHTIAVKASATKATSAGAVKAPRRVGSHSTAAIAPLVTTKWDQDSPYNDLCPEYTSGQNSATGCVATAMAQVMKYHQWPQAATKTIPSYYCSSLSQTLSSLPATTFNWANMLDEYSYHWTGSGWQKISDGTTAQRTAVATLMKYCGWSVEMDYGEQSGSNTDYVANALKNYYSYNATTTQCVKRGDYSAAKWADLIYYELAHQRPVVYGGQSTGGGHEFVCDGYKYENSTDFFHINWGWGGMSDEYFVLSALDPDAQGIGGSTSTDGFRTGQDAVIGVQPSTSSVPIADITPNTFNLTLNSLTLSRNPAFCSMPIDITLNITNNSEDDYEGPVWVGRVTGSQVSFLVSGEFVLPAGQTVDVVIPFTPTASGTYNLIFMYPIGGGYFSYNINDVLATLEVIEKPVIAQPANVVASNITGSSANISWTGSSDNYNVRYKAVKSITYDFESAEPWVVDDFAPFTTYDGDGLPTWGINGATFTNQYYIGSVIAFQNGTNDDFTAHSGNAFGCFMDAQPDGTNYNNDWFITPEIEVTAGMVFSFWARSVNDYYGLERIKVGVYGNTDGTFSSYLEGSATTYAEVPVTWTQFTYDLSAYVGQTIKLAINCVSEDAFALCIDDVLLGIPGSDTWEGTLTNVATPCFLSGLTPVTTYEVQVQAVSTEGTSAWSKSATFTTNNIKLGDANVDTNVTITDAVAVVNYILGNPSSDFSKAAANVNGDLDEKGEPNITITDAVGVVNIILNNGSSAPKMEVPDAEPIEAAEPE